MPSQPCSFTDFEEGICFDADDPDFGAHTRKDRNKENIRFFVDGKILLIVIGFTFVVLIQFSAI